MSDTPTIIGSAEACRRLGDVNRSTLTRWVHSGRLITIGRVSDKANGALLFEASEIQRFRRELDAEQHKKRTERSAAMRQQQKKASA